MADEQRTIGAVQDEQPDAYNEAARVMADKVQARIAAIGPRAYYLEQARTDAHEAMAAIEAGNWLRADLFLKLALDEIKDAGVLP